MPDDPQLVRLLNSALPRERRRPVINDETQDVLAADTVPALLELSDGGYSYRVTTSLQNDDLFALYMDPALIRRTHAVLIRKRTAELRSEEGRNHRTNQAARRRVRRFLDLIERRIEQVETALGDSTLEVQRRTINMLRSAIHAHQQALADNDVIPEAWDERLWRVLEQIAPARRPRPTDVAATAGEGERDTP